MLYSVARELLKQRMSRFSPSAASINSLAMIEFNAAVDELEAEPFLPYFLEQDATVIVPAGVRYTALISGFLEQNEIEPLITVAGGFRKLKRLPRKLMEVDPRFGDLVVSATGTPTHYDISVNRLYVAPTPDANYEISINGYYADTAIANDADETLWLKYAPHVLINKVGMMFTAGYMKSADGYAFFAGEFQRTYDALKKKNTAREYSALDGGLVE